MASWSVDEVRRKIAAVELHSLDHVEGRLRALGFLDGDRPILADPVHRVGDQFADGGVSVGRHGGDLSDFAVLLNFLAERREGLHGDRHCLLDAALDLHRFESGRNRSQALDVDGLGQHRGSGRAVAGHIARFRGRPL